MATLVFKSFSFSVIWSCSLSVKSIVRHFRISYCSITMFTDRKACIFNCSSEFSHEKCKTYSEIKKILCDTCKLCFGQMKICHASQRRHSFFPLIWPLFLFALIAVEKRYRDCLFSYNLHFTRVHAFKCLPIDVTHPALVPLLYNSIGYLGNVCSL